MQKVDWSIIYFDSQHNVYFFISAYGKITVTKSCTASVCTRPLDRWEDDQCEQMKWQDSYVCNICCKDSECNSAKQHSVVGLLLAAVLLLGASL